ncbi:uncharacterized protein LOC105693309 [Athalia rosae]|uniref:uncharacterized protein LOC105693309 n=1 Tax=Athalia rosae TaxID=37344 RepID=UPI0020332F00|nr:uncharacterized protein LOC105693309 [Athalia rosae]
MARHILILLLCSLILQSGAWSQLLFNTTPRPINSNFTCAGRLAGYYADLSSNCRVYHNCDDQGNKFSYHCPEMTAFRQEALVCDHAHLVDCQTAATQILINRAEKSKKTVGASPTVTTINPFSNLFIRKDAAASQVSKPWPANVRFKTAVAQETPFHLGLDARHTFAGMASTFASNQTTVAQLASGRNSGMEKIAMPFDYRWVQFSGDRPKSKSNGSRFDGSTGRDLIANSRGHLGWKFTNRSISTAEINADGEHHTQPSAYEYSRMKSSPMTSRSGSYPEINGTNTKSTQISGQTKLTPSLTTLSPSDILFPDFTASLKPLVPNALEYDPYYPREPWTTTETYYTPSERSESPRAFDSPNFQPSLIGVRFKIPDILPDLNTIDDIVERRKHFFIPRNRN